MIETVPLANAAEAYGRMMRNEARFRIVLVKCSVPIRLVSERRVYAAAPSRCHGIRSYSSRHRALAHRHAFRSVTKPAFTGLFSV